MKILALVCAMVLIYSGCSLIYGQVPRLSRDSIKTRIDESLAALPHLLNRDPAGRLAQAHVNQQRLGIDVIMPYFYGVPGALHEHSLARQERVLQVEQWLAPYEPILIQVMTASASYNQFPDGIGQLLAFAKPTENLRGALLAIARDPKTDPQIAGGAYNALFMLQMDDDALRREVVEMISWRDELHTRASLGAELLTMAATRWAMPELEAMYRDFLSVPYKPENYPSRGGRAKLQNQYDLAIRGLKAFGTLGASFAGLLKARLAEMDPTEDADLINSCKETILMVEGKCNPKPVVSWKGVLLGVSNQAYTAWLANHSTSATASKGSQSMATSSAQSMKGKANHNAEGANESVGDASFVLWLVVSALIAALGGAAVAAAQETHGKLR